MTENKTEILYQQLANRYIEEYGTQLQNELHHFEHQSSAAPTVSLDKRVKAATSSKRSPIRIFQWCGLAAACFALLLLAPKVLQEFSPRQNTMEATSQAAAEAQDEAGSQLLESGNAPATNSTELIPLGFELPSAFSIESTALDNGVSIYSLSTTSLDSVVLSMVYTSEALDTTGLVPYSVAGQTVYGIRTKEYNLIRFQHGGIEYNLTSRYDLHILFELAEIVIES